MSLAIVAEALGHADTRMISKRYGHLAPSHIADAIRAHLPALGIELDGTVTRLRPLNDWHASTDAGPFDLAIKAGKRCQRVTAEAQPRGPEAFDCLGSVSLQSYATLTARTFRPTFRRSK